MDDELLAEEDQCPYCWDTSSAPNWENRYGTLCHRDCWDQWLADANGDASEGLYDDLRAGVA